MNRWLLYVAVSAIPCISDLKCVNGGTLDESVCRCYCPRGYHGRKCEVGKSIQDLSEANIEINSLRRRAQIIAKCSENKTNSRLLEK